MLPVFKYSALLSLSCINLAQACPVENDRMEINLNGHTLISEVAANHKSQRCGLAFRSELPANHGMLFAFTQDLMVTFWMKDTLIPLSIAFLDADGKILEIHDMDPDEPQRRYVSSMPVRYALEVNMGWFEENNILVGERVTGVSS